MTADDIYGYEGPPSTDAGCSDVPATPAGATSLADCLRGRDGTWVTFRRDASLDLEGVYSNHLTPHAVYGLDSSWVTAQADAYASAGSHQRLRMYFHGLGYVRRPHAVVFNVDGRVVSSATYSGIVEDAERLVEHVSRNHPAATDVLSRRWNLQVHADDPRRSFMCLFYMTEMLADRIVGSVEWRDYRVHPDKPAAWRDLLLALGIDALEDRSHLMTGEVYDQIAVVNAAAVRIVADFPNPAAAPGPGTALTVAGVPSMIRGR